MRRADPPRISINSALTISKIACAWLLPDCRLGSAASDLSRIKSMKESTTESATSDSSSAERISAQVFSISEVLNLPRERSAENAPVNLVESESNRMSALYLRRLAEIFSSRAPHL
jgi:hypothetical protein